MREPARGARHASVALARATLSPDPPRSGFFAAMSISPLTYARGLSMIGFMHPAITAARQAARLAQLLADAQLTHAAELAIRVRRQWPEPVNEQAYQAKETV